MPGGGGERRIGALAYWGWAGGGGETAYRRIGVWAKRGGGDRRIGVSAFGPVYGGRGTAYRRIGVVAGGEGEGRTIGVPAYRRTSFFAPLCMHAEMLEVSVRRYNNQVHGTTKMSPNKAHDIDKSVQVRANTILKEKHNRKYPRIEEGDYVKVFDKGKGNYTSRKESRSTWSENKYKVNLKSRDMMNNTFTN